MKKKKFTPLTAKELRPEGWLRQQLKIQAEGLSGHLDLIWPDIRDSKWIGGDKEGWERVPYWLDGFIPLAYLLEDEELKKTCGQIHRRHSGASGGGWLDLSLFQGGTQHL